MVDVLPTGETTPPDGSGDDADDLAFGINPANPSLSTIVGVSKNSKGGLYVFNLDGTLGLSSPKILL
ncbi:MAG: phytase [Planctomycetes bacterium]|nr:phytase [Planctomycetota bacterium]